MHDQMTPHNDSPTDEPRDAESTDGGKFTRRQTLAIGGAAIGASAMGAGSVFAQDDGGNETATGNETDQGDDAPPGGGGSTFRFTITNLTGGQAFTPPAVATHSPSTELFSVGEPANEVVQELAENGNLEPLAVAVQEDTDISGVGLGEAPLVPSDDPGDTGHPYYVTLEVDADQDATHMTFISMLIATNDGFVGLDTVELPTEVNGSKTLYPGSYDAGTEENTETWDDLVPAGRELIGGQTPTGGTTETDEELAEDGVIHPHPGTMGEGDLDPEVYGWEDPAAVVHVEKIDGPDDVQLDDGEGDGNVTDGDGNATDGDGNVTDGEGNVTDGDGNVTDGDGNVTGDGGNATDGAGNATDGNATDGNATNGGNDTTG
ncbi:hypothetical protein L593_12385 [Salinarchaeum sp. Harcht-Bsk1]|nr:hypothetical protein L593_12385 [Salinarchaeum sp. Harcht-Bsk1]